MRPERTLLQFGAPFGVLLGLLLGLTPVALARDIPYGEVTDAAVQRCDALHWSGQREAAVSCYQLLAAGNGPAAQRAEAAWALGDLSAANDLFRAAAAAHPRDARVRARWGELYEDSHQGQQASELFKEALQRDPQDAFAAVDTAAVLVDDYAQQADSDLQAVMKNSGAPAGARLRAQLLAARVALEDGDPTQAGTWLDRAGALAEHAHLPPLQVYALRAALQQYQGHDGARWIALALKQDPHFGDAYAVPAYFDVIRWRQAQAIDLYRKALAVQPDLWSAQVQLASALLRVDDVDRARSLLQSAYRGDPYDPVTVNTLRLLDSLQQFDVLKYGSNQSAGAALILHISPKEGAILGPYARRLAERALQTFSLRYRFQLRSPVNIEIYPNHDDLAVRTAGLPGLGGELGVSFGYVVAMDSPSSRAQNEFNWGTTLWHEMAHVFTLESTDFRVPRWLTEGLSVFEEWRTGPIRGIEIPDYVYVALAQGKALPIVQLNRGFVRPQYPQQLVVSYMQAGLICDFIDRSFGFDKLLALLHAFEHTDDVSVALQRSLGLSAAQFDARFTADLDQHYGMLFAHIGAWQAARAAAAEAAQRSDWAQARSAATQALALLPQDVDEGSPYLPLAGAYAGSGQPQRALATLLEYWHRGGHDAHALELLSQRLHAAGRLNDAIAVLESVNYQAPFDVGLHGELGDWLLEADRAQDALGEYRIDAALHPTDQATLHLRLARAQYALHALPDARREALAALEVAPDFQAAQQLLLRIVRAGASAGGQQAPSNPEGSP
ncbi:MAG: peptidase MA family metallohydrolase [Steroidobacteraceae bacterium]